MTRARAAVDVSAMPDVVRLAEEAARRGTPLRLMRDAAIVAVLVPSRRQPRRKSRALTPAQIEAVHSTFGAWKNLIDPERLKRDLNEAQGDDRPPVHL